MTRLQPDSCAVVISRPSWNWSSWNWSSRSCVSSVLEDFKYFTKGVTRRSGCTLVMTVRATRLGAQ